MDTATNPLFRAARAVARTRSEDGALRPEDEAAARAVIDELTRMDLILTPARLHQLRATQLHALRAEPMLDLDLWETERIRVVLWLLKRALDAERASATAATTIVPTWAVPARPRAAA